jgi:tetratricopeptide (TPR) repeat protein
MTYRAVHRELVRFRAGRGIPERPVFNTVYRCFQPGRVRLDVDLVVDIAHVLTANETAAEEWRQACWVVTGTVNAAAIVEVNDSWPPDVPAFVGRDAYLQTIVTSGVSLRSTFVISGMPGVGKTWLAVRAGRLLLARGGFADVRLAVNLRGFDPDRPPADPNAVLYGFLRGLGIPGDQVQRLSLTERAARFRHLLSDRTALILLDNAASTEQVRPLLPASPHCVTLVTSRRTLPDLPAVRHVSLDVMALDEAVDTLRRTANRVIGPEERDIAVEIVELLGRLPLAIDLVASRIRHNPDWTLIDHLERIQHHWHSLRLDRGVELAISLSYRALRPAQQRAFRLMALHSGSDVTPPAAAALLGTSVAEARAQLDELVSVNLVRRVDDERHRYHDMVRTFAAGRAFDEDAASTRRSGLSRLARYYLYAAMRAMDLLYPHAHDCRPQTTPSSVTAPPLTDSTAARHWLDLERANLLAVATTTTGGDATVGAFAATLHRHFAVRGHYLDAHLLHELAVSAARRANDRAGEVTALLDLAEINIRTGQYESAIDNASRARVLAQEASLEVEGRTLRYLGLAHRYTGQLEWAADYYRTSLELCRREGDRVGEGSALGNLGELARLSGRFDLAADYLRQAVPVFDELDDAENRGRVLSDLGLLLQIVGRYQEAAEHQHQALTIFAEVDATEAQATAHDNLGVVYQMTGDYRRAAEHHERALALSRQIGDQDDEARALVNLGDLYRRTGRNEEAASRHNAALAQYRELGDPDGQTRALNGLGETFLAAGEPRRAITAHAEAHEHASKMGQLREQARADHGLGDAHHAVGDTGQAQVHWRRAHELYSDMGLPEADVTARQLDDA